VPDEQREFVGKRQPIASLRTKVPAAAKHLAPPDLVQSDAILAAARRQLGGVSRRAGAGVPELFATAKVLTAVGAVLTWRVPLRRF